MIATAPMPFPMAVRRLASKTPVASRLGTAEMEKVELGLLDRSFFSARVDDIRKVAGLQSRIDDALTLTRRDGGAFMDRSRFVADMRAELGATPGDTGQLTDITSARRLGLIYDFNTEDAFEYGRWLARQDPALLAMFPWNELVRVEHREVPRGHRKGPGGKLVPVPEESWPARWEAAGGIFTGGRMIARKDDPIWIAISRFGRPWPPFDFMSGMGLADVAVDEGEAEGLTIPKDKPVQPQHLDFNHALQASIPEATPENLARLKAQFGDQIEAGRDGKVTWQGQRIARLYEAALADPAVKWSLDLGEATPEAIAAARSAGVDLTGAQLEIEADEIRHVDGRHGAAEPRPDQRPVTSVDLQLIPHVWRNPDSIVAGAEPGSLVFSRDLLGRSVVVVYDRRAKSPRWGFLSLFVKKKGGTP